MADELDHVVGGRTLSFEGGAYRAVQRVQAGAGIDTWRGVEAATGAAVAIKVLASSDVAPGVEHRLRREAEVLRELSSPHIAPLVRFGREGDRLYVVTRWVDGEALDRVVARGPLGVTDALGVAASVLAALRDAHAVGIVHRDVKPSNVVVRREGGAASAVLVDFGFAFDPARDGATSARAVGTARYMSPEQAGLIGADVDERADLYSAGALIFECLAGEALFPGASIADVLRQHLSSLPRDLHGFDPAIPRALDALVKRLLRKDPRDRYQSAEGALHDVERVAEALRRGDPDPEVALGARDARRTLIEPEFVGRAAELAALQAHQRRSLEEPFGLVLLEGESGSGKTRLLDELGHRCAQAGARVFRGKGLAEVGQRPFEVLVGVGEEVAAVAQAEAPFAARVRAALAQQDNAAAAALPVLASLGPRLTVAASPEAFGEARALAALVALFAALGDDRPALVLLDDCQWADASTHLLLRLWAQHVARARAPSRVLVVAAFRAEEVGPEHPLRELGAPAVSLRAMSRDDADLIARSMAGDLPPAALDVIARLAEGSPFMVASVLRGLVESSALRPRDGGGWETDPDALAEASSSRRAAAFLARRFAILPARSIALLSAGAVLGREFPVDLATALAGLSAEEAAGALDEGRSRHIVWARPQGDRAVFFHDKLRETLLARLSPDERRRLHLEAATRLSAEVPPPAGGRPARAAAAPLDARVFEVAYHFDAAGAPERALPYALGGADHARASHALDAAEQQFRIAERGVGEADRAGRQRIAEGLGDVLMLRGRYDAAAEALERAEGLSEGDDDRARVAGKRGELAFKRGDVAGASRAIERGLRLLGRRVPAGAAEFVVLCLWEIVLQALHTAAPRWFVARRPLAAATRDMRSIPLYSRLAYAYWFERGQVPCLWAHLRGMNLAERYPPTLELAQAYSEHAPVMTMIPLFARGERYAQRSLAIRTALHDAWGRGQALHFHGIVLYAASRFEACIERCTEAVRLLERTGDLWEMNTARWHIAYSHYRLGRMREAVEVARQVRESGAAIGDAQARAISLAVWSKATRGAVPEAWTRADVDAIGSDVHATAETLQADAVRLIAQRSYGAAADQLRRAQALIERRGLKQEYVAPVLPWLSTALRLALEERTAYSPADTAARVVEALRVSRRAVAVARVYRNNLPHALRERGMLLAMAARPRAARRALDEGLAAAEALSMRQEVVEALRARACVGRGLGWPGADDDRARADELQRRLSPDAEAPEAARAAVVTLSLVDRFDALLLVGRELAGALDRESVYAALRRAGASLLRAEGVMLIEVDGGPDEVTCRTGDPGEFSQTVVERATREERPIVVLEAQAGPSDSAVLSGARSILCVPVRSRRSPTVCLYVTHSQLGHLFGEPEARLAEFIAALGAAALESAENFSRTQALAEEREVLYREAQAAVRAREEFLSIASHELRTPLTPLLLQLHSLERALARPADAAGVDRLSDRVRVASRQSERLVTLVDNLLDVSRISAGRLTLQLERLSVPELVRDAVERFASQARAAGSTLRFTSVGDLDARWDRVRVEQVLHNLLSNAIKYGRSSPIEVCVDADARSATVVVRDGGVGIAPAEASKLFVRFGRAHAARTFGGLGLGLFIARSIVEAHGGTLTVLSAVDVGSTFTVTLPLEPERTTLPLPGADPDDPGDAARCA